MTPTGSNAPGVDPRPVAGATCRPARSAFLARRSAMSDRISRPECILAESDGRLVIADKRGTCTVLCPDGLATPLRNDEIAAERHGAQSRGLPLCGEHRRRPAVSGRHRDRRRDGGHGLFEGRPSVPSTSSTSTCTTGSGSRCRQGPSPGLRHQRSGCRRLCPVDRERPTAPRRRPSLLRQRVRTTADDTVLYIAETTAGRVTRCSLALDGTPTSREAQGPAPIFAGARSRWHHLRHGG